MDLIERHSLQTPVRLQHHGIDSVIVLDTCASDAVVPRFPTKIDSPVAANALLQPLSGMGFVTAAGGVYRLCWCARGFPCRAVRDYAVDVGQLLLLGPAQLFEARTCVAGQTLSLIHI